MPAEKRLMGRAVPQIWARKGWRRGVAILGAAYCLVAWVLPVVVMVIFRDLPYLHERGFVERLVLSAAGTAALVAAMVLAFPERTRIYRGSTRRETAKGVLGAALGLVMFTAIAAHWSGNTFGTFASVLPGSGYSARFTVTEVDEDRRSVFLALRPKDGTKEVYLTMSKRIFEVPAVDIGDELVVSGKQTLAGVYVDGFRLLRKARP